MAIKPLDTEILDWLRAQLTRSDLDEIVSEALAVEPFSYEHMRQAVKDHVSFAYLRGEWPEELTLDDLERLVAFSFEAPEVFRAATRKDVLKQIYVATLLLHEFAARGFREGSFCMPDIVLDALVQSIGALGDLAITARRTLFLDALALRGPPFAEESRNAAAVLMLATAAKRLSNPELEAYDQVLSSTDRVRKDRWLQMAATSAAAISANLKRGQ